ncbi:ABC transporter substrate-binding protein [soil metagenome]
MAIFKRRLIFWLLKAYLKKWGKIITISFVIGLLLFLGFLKMSAPLLRMLQIHKRPSIGLIGVYTVENLPSPVIKKLSRGLTTVAEDGNIRPDLATSWDINDNGKTYTFHLKQDVFFNDNTPLTSDTVTYDFSDVKVERPNRYTITYRLKDPYAPFLVTVSRPLFKKGFVGVGEYKMEKIELNGSFLKSLRLTNLKNKSDSEDYQIYPTEEALKVAFALGEVGEAISLTDDSFKDTAFHTFPTIKTEKVINYSQLVTIFYNNKDSILSDKKIRGALTYSLPDTFSFGKRNYLPYAEHTWFYNKELLDRQQDYEHGKALLDSTDVGTQSAQLSFTLKVLQRYMPAAKEVQSAWKKLGVVVKLEPVDTIPNDFQMYLGDFFIPRDPDQYTLWHADQQNNITHYKNLRIDKLLEDGRKTVGTVEREKMYKEFQKYLLDDSPASFLYYPYEYHLTRK